ncbi:MAG TPA: DUF58 domain-containing protein [Jiangellaceae bacterium]|nr:DUF58 domain-containing protein [Jiangellaceae bacterium]
MTDVRVPLRWRPSRLAGRLATVGALAAAAGLILGRPELVVVAVPSLALLAAGRRGRPGTLTVTATTPGDRYIEGDTVDVHVSIDPGPAHGGVRAELTLPSTAWDGSGTVAAAGHRQAAALWPVRPTRWGRRSLGPVRLTAWGPSRLDVATDEVTLGRVDVHPPPASARHLPLPPRLVQRLGLHAGRTEGAGVEFASVRPYQPGDAVRRIHWPATARRGRLHLTRHAVERAADAVMVIDATTDVAGTLDLAVRGAAGAAQTYLAAGDRVGVVALGGIVRWLPPGTGSRQVHRVVETVLDVRVDDSYVAPDLARLPRRALPPGALVVAFSPLLDAAVTEILRDLRERGHPTVVVDVLRAEPDPPPGTRAGPEAVRLWRLERGALRHELAAIGITVVPWGPDDDAIGVLDRISVRLNPQLAGGVR